jgi:hypothetical protein
MNDSPAPHDTIPGMCNRHTQISGKREHVRENRMKTLSIKRFHEIFKDFINFFGESGLFSEGICRVLSYLLFIIFRVMVRGFGDFSSVPSRSATNKQV